MSLSEPVAILSGILSVSLAVYCNVPYYKSIFAGKTKPHQMTWLVFGIMNGIVTVSQLLAGGRVSVLLPATFFVANVFTVLLSFKYGVRETSRYDKLLFTASLITIAIWIATRSNEAAIWLTVLIDIFATAMTVLKIKAFPDSEEPTAWNIAGLAYVFSCLSLVRTQFGILYVRPVYGLLSDMVIIGAIYYFGQASKNPKQVDSPAQN